MKLNKMRLGELIEMCDERNSEGKYGIDDVKGISTGKEFIDTKANMDGVSLASYKVVNKDDFAYVADTSRRGEKIAVAYNKSDAILISSIYTVFKVKRKDLLLSDYLFMYFNRPEFDRYARFNSWGSARETFDFADLCDITITLPPLETQKDFVAVYNAMAQNQKAYEKNLDDLKLACDAYIEQLRRKMPSVEIGEYIRECNARNFDLKIDNIQGVNSGSVFDKTKANTLGLDFSNYKIVRHGQFAYNPSRINLGSIALLQDEDCIVSPMYIVFEIVDTEKLLPEYLMLWYGRSEFQRSTIFYATGSVRDTFDMSAMRCVKIPIPEISIQKSIAAIYSAYIQRKAINERLKRQIKEICPVLIKGSLEGGAVAPVISTEVSASERNGEISSKRDIETKRSLDYEPSALRSR